jgi:Carboxypeptidase regulatory-like domain
MLRSISVGLAVLMALATSFSQTGNGRVEGVVLDQSGTPLPNATVFIGTVARGPSTQTDREGRFVLEGVPVGTVGLHAYKVSDGYPYDMFAFFSMPGEKEPFVEVMAGQTVANVVIQLGARAAFLSLYITDEKGSPTEAELSFSRPDLGKTGNYERGGKSKEESLMVPPVPCRLTVEASGFEPWHYGGNEWQTDKGLVRLKSGQNLSLSVRLRRSQTSH